MEEESDFAQEMRKIHERLNEQALEFYPKGFCFKKEKAEVIFSFRINELFLQNTEFIYAESDTAINQIISANSINEKYVVYLPFRLEKLGNGRYKATL